jgi:hypothetical protein
MKGVVVIPNVGSVCAAIQRMDDFIMVVEPPSGTVLNFLDSVELMDTASNSTILVRNLTSGSQVEVIVRKIDVDLPWEEKMALWGKKTL